MAENRILQTIRQQKLLEQNMDVVVGLSGGADSLCMFDVLCAMAEEWQLRLYPVHVNHKFRPGAAEADQAFVEGFCREKGWPCRSFEVDCSALAQKEGLTSEEAGRKARYDAFRQVAAEIRTDRPVAIAVAQNAGDQAETILFRILRGTGTTGLAGIAYLRYDEDGNRVIRPLLDTDRSLIETYCEEHGLTPRRDHTNEEAIYTRNKIRLELLPYLKEYNPNIMGALNRLGAAAAEDTDCLLQQAEAAFHTAADCIRTRDAADGGGEGTGILLSTEVLKNLHPAIRKRVYHIALQRIGCQENLTAAHISGMEQVVASASPSASWNLPQGYIAERRYDVLALRKTSNFDEKGSLKVSIQTAAGSGRGQRGVFSLEALTEVYGEDAPEKIILRTRQKGDYMVITTGGELHRKKLQDLLVDMKVPKGDRDRIRLAALGSEILWILPEKGFRGRMSSAYRASDETKAPIIVLEYLG